METSFRLGSGKSSESVIQSEAEAMFDGQVAKKKKKKERADLVCLSVFYRMCALEEGIENNKTYVHQRAFSFTFTCRRFFKNMSTMPLINKNQRCPIKSI